jgi:hypothetical protein
MSASKNHDLTSNSPQLHHKKPHQKHHFSQNPLQKRLSTTKQKNKKMTARQPPNRLIFYP